MVRIQLEPLRGMRDVIPPESEHLIHIVDVFREVVESYGYRRIVTPTIERFKLFALKSGEEIRRTMYVFRDKGGREVALRPEFTPSVVRVYLRLLRGEAKPIRLYYIGPVFRYDEPQRGRYREFNQAGVELLGAESLYHDIELLLILRDFYRRINLGSYVFKVNNIGVVKALARDARLEAEQEEKLLHLLDKGLVNEARALLLERNAETAEILEKLASYRRVSPSELDRAISAVRETAKASQSIERELEVVTQLRDLLLDLGVTNFYVDLAFARGIAYYTGPIFEVEVPSLGLSIAGGGRYDNLTCIYGGPPLKMTGFAIGVERTLLALEGFQLEKKRKKVLVASVSEVESLRYGIKVAEDLRARGAVAQVEFVESPRRLSRVFEYASKKGFDFVVVIGKRELEQRKASVKNLSSWTQTTVDLDAVPEVIMDEYGHS